jgi:hypothetical protein
VRVFFVAIFWAICMLYFISDRIWGDRPVGSLPQPARLLAYIESALFGIDFGLVLTFRSRTFRNGLFVVLVLVFAAAVATKFAVDRILFP